jgi:pimeloyl-ACP methyl ester carboxylesterase
VKEFGANRVKVIVVRNASHALPVENPGAAADAIVSYARGL